MSQQLDMCCQDEVYRSMWERAIEEAIEKLVGVTGVSKLMFVGTSDGGPPTAHQEHLACFFPGEAGYLNQFYILITSPSHAPYTHPTGAAPSRL